MGKGSRNHARKYRIVVHSKEFYRKQRELKARRAKAESIRKGDIFFEGEASLELKLDLNPLGKPMILALPKKKNEPDGVKC